jgi:hypothetical protein
MRSKDKEYRQRNHRPSYEDVSSSLNFPENRRFDFAIAAVAGTGRLNAPRWGTERACVGRAHFQHQDRTGHRLE